MKKRSNPGGLILIALLLVLLVEGCTTGAPPSATSATDSVTKKPYGSLTIAVDFGANLDPRVYTSAYYGLTATIFDPLVWTNADGQLEPGIAERWEISPDGKTHTFYIRKGVKFSDGSDLTGADVKFTIERTLAPEATLTHVPLWRSSISRVELKDDYTVVIYMKQPQFELLRGFSRDQVAVVPKKYVEEKGDSYFAKNPMGSGPFRLVSYEPGTRVELEAKESHWRQTPAYSKVTLLNVTDASTRVAMLKTGELDIARVASDSVSDLRSVGQRIVPYDGGHQYVLHMFYDMDNPAQYAMGDLRVRKALSLALDRSGMSGLGGGYAEPSAVYIVFKTAYFFDPNVLKPDPYDPEQAKKLMAEAGYPSGFKTKLWTVGAGDQTVYNLATVGYWRKVGVDAEMRQSDLATVRSMFAPKQIPEIWNTAYGKITAAQPGTEGFITVYHSTGVLRNVNIPRLDKLIDELIPGAADPAEKKKLAQEAALLGKNDYSNLSVLYVRQLLSIGSRVGELTPKTGMDDVGVTLATITHAK